MGANIYPPAKVDEKKYRENYDRIFNKENNMHDELHMEIGDLRDQIKELEEELHQQRFNNHHNFTVDQKVIDQIAELERDNEVLKEACEFYAKKENYTELHDYKGLHYFELIGNSPLQDQGDRARRALSKIRSEG